MCGISGIINLNNKAAEEQDVRLMMEKMKHRGPDDEGVFIEDNIGLGFVRLSILDLTIAGHQPMFSNDNNLIIIFNGEIFNYIEIKEQLKDKYEFKTGTDTEVILAAYKEWGDSCLDKLNGMFAFVVYNRTTKNVFAARDRFGIKPFYYYQDEDKFIFASEIKSILPLLKTKEPNNQLIYDYLIFNRTDHTENTFFKNIKKLNHGNCLNIKDNQLTFSKWYDLSLKVQKSKPISPEEYRDLFKESLKLRLRSDVPVGVSLSGGIDSSAVVSSLIKDFDLTELNTFSAVYGKQEATDESEFIDEFKSMVKNMHYTSPDADTFFDDFESFIDAHNEPVPDIGPYVQFKVMELVRDHVTVTLDGQGADEMLAGYHNFFGPYYIELLRGFNIPKFIKENYYYFKKHKSLNALKFFIYYLLPEKLQTSLTSNRLPSLSKNFLNNVDKTNRINKMLYKSKNLNEALLQHFEYKLEHLLRWGDLNSMHFSIESRVPFLDYRLVEATISSPSLQKISNGETKHILREAVKDILPEKIINRKDKKGFSNPREKWFRSEKFKTYIFELINSEQFKNRGYFDSVIANKQYKKHLNGESDLSVEIWKWINLEIWFRKFID